MQQWLQKSVESLLIFGRLQSQNTIFIAATLGWPSLECHVEKEVALLVVVFTTFLTTTTSFDETN